MTQELNKATDDLSKAENMYALQIIPKKEIDEAKFLKESIEMKMETYKNQFMLSISENMENIQKTIKNIENSFIEVEGELRLQKIRNDKLVALDQSIEVEKQKLPQISNKLDSISLAIENCSVYAKVSGKMHVLREFRKGDKLQSGVELATILPENDEELKVQLFISNSDISSIKTGDSVKFHFYALPYKEYGELTGTISTISSDAQINQTEVIDMAENRYFQMVYLLMGKGSMTAPELAKYFEVSVRTIYRDIDVMSAVGIPIYATQGKGGGIAIQDNFILIKSLISEQEQTQILMALQGFNIVKTENTDML